MPSLRERFERARKPGAPQADVDVLLAGLAPGAPQELSPLELSALLHLIIRDRHLSSRRDRQGRQVLHVAAEAMQALGPPYAQQLPASALPPAPPVRQLSGLFYRRITIGLLLLAIVAGLEWLAFKVTASRPPWQWVRLLPRIVRSEWLAILYPWLVSLMPALFSLWALRTRREEPLQIAAWMLWITGLARLLLFALNGLVHLHRAIPIFLLTGALTALAGFCFRPLWEAYRQKSARSA
jgi:hypothetical protein